MLASTCFALVFVVVGIAWPNHLAGFATCISVSKLATTELIYLGDIGTGTVAVVNADAWEHQIHAENAHPGMKVPSLSETFYPIVARV